MTSLPGFCGVPMAARRRDPGNGTVYWDEGRGRWVGQLTVGYSSAGRQMRRKVSAMTKAEAQAKLKALRAEAERGVDLRQGSTTVADAVESWLRFGLNGRSVKTREQNRILAKHHIVPLIGSKRLHDLKAVDVDRMLAARRRQLSTSTLQRVLSILRRVLRWAESRDLVGRNVAMLVTCPTGRDGRPSKAMTLAEAKAVLAACDRSPLGAYVTLAILLGIRNEELRALTWDHVDLIGAPRAEPRVPPSLRVWRSVRAGGDTKTRLSRRTIGLPSPCVAALEKHRAAMAESGQDVVRGLVFCTQAGTALDSANVRRSFRALIADAGLDANEWTPRELRHSFVSVMSEAGVPIESIARLVGHASTKVTETIYRKELRPVITDGTEIVETLFDMPIQPGKQSDPPG